MCMQLRCDKALTIIRMMLGALFIAHGSQKVLGLFGGPGLSGFASWLGTYGVPPVLAYLSAFSEFIGGLLLLSGYFTWLGGIMTSVVMLGAIFIIHWPNFFVQNNGFEYPLMLIVTTFAVVLGTPCGMRACDKDRVCDKDEDRQKSGCC